jgi:hypothetical protein
MAMQAAALAARDGQWRACVDAYKQSFRKSGRLDFGPRYHVVSGLCAVLRDEECPTSPDDMDLFEEVIRDEKEHAECRIQCAFTRGVGGDRTFVWYLS